MPYSRQAMRDGDPGPAADAQSRFCASRPSRRLIIDSGFGYAAWDRHPVSEGHFLVIPHWHFAS
jgi:hypothetical protein